MVYQKIEMELIVEADEAEDVVRELNATLDRLEETHTLYGGGMETIAVEHPGARRRSALMHARAAGETAAAAVQTAGEKVASAIRGIF
jgi:hypothetical protein